MLWSARHTRREPQLNSLSASSILRSMIIYGKDDRKYEIQAEYYDDGDDHDQRILSICGVRAGGQKGFSGLDSAPVVPLYRWPLRGSLGIAAAPCHQHSDIQPPPPLTGMLETSPLVVCHLYHVPNTPRLTRPFDICIQSNDEIQNDITVHFLSER